MRDMDTSIIDLLCKDQLKVLLEIHSILMTRDTNETALFQRICDRLIELRPYRMVWVKKQAAEGETTIVAEAAEAVPQQKEIACGSGNDCLSSSNMPNYLPEPAVISVEISSSLNLMPCKKPAREFQAGSILSQRLMVGTQCIGVISVHTRDMDDDSQEQALLHLLARDISFAIAMLRKFAAIETAPKELTLAGAVFDSALEGIIITDDSGKILAANPSVCLISGYDMMELVGQTPAIFKSGHHDRDFYAEMWGRLKQIGRWQGEIWNKRKNGNVYPQWLSISAVRNELLEEDHYIAVLTDISEIKQAEERLHHLAFHDELTGLPNRTLFKKHLNQAIAHAHRSGEKLAVLFLDIDNFKFINDSLGHSEGDALLQAVAERLTHNIREDDIVSRLGGDEFTMLLEGINGEQGAAAIAQKIMTAMSLPVALGGQDLCITNSIGISLYPDDGTTPEVLMKHADTAMYHAKSQGKNNFQFYTDKMNIHATERLALERDLRAALNRGEFLMYYQPQVALDDGKICGAEALLRWRRNDQMISPAEFIPATEESGLIIPIGEWVLQTVCLQNKVWQTRGLPPLRVAVNLSTRQFRQKGLAELIGSLLQDIGLDPRCLELELTEGAAMQNPEEAAAILKALKKTGIRISIDDFGTGYSSLSYLKKFPLDTLKIDQSFVRDITTDPNDAAIVQAVIAMAHGLGLKVLAEGVETQEQAAFLRLHKCDMAQGYYFGRPMPVDAFYELIIGSTETKARTRALQPL